MLFGVRDWVIDCVWSCRLNTYYCAHPSYDLISHLSTAGHPKPTDTEDMSKARNAANEELASHVMTLIDQKNWEGDIVEGTIFSYWFEGRFFPPMANFSIWGSKNYPLSRR